MSEFSLADLSRVNGQTPMESVSRVASLAIILAAFTLCNVAQARNSPDCPYNVSISGPGVVTYDPLSLIDTMALFTLSGGTYRSAETYRRQVGVFKQLTGQESEGLHYRFSALQGLDQRYQESETIPWAGSIWRGSGPKEHSARYGSKEANVAPNAVFTITIPKSQMLSAGTRRIHFMAYATYEELSTCMLNSGKTLPQEQLFEVNVLPAMALSLAGGSSTGTVDFGSDLATSAKRTVNLRLRSNISYQITMDSGFGGVLKLDDKPEALDQIVYTTTLNGTLIDENRPFVFNNPVTSNGADITVPFEVTIGDTSNARAGFYKDTVKLTIASRP